MCTTLVSFNSKIYAKSKGDKLHYCPPPGPNSGGTRPLSSPWSTPLHMHWKLHWRCWIHSWNIVQTKMQKKLQISRHFQIKFWPLAELDPTRPALSCKFSDPTRPGLTHKSGQESCNSVTDPRTSLLHRRLNAAEVWWQAVSVQLHLTQHSIAEDYCTKSIHIVQISTKDDLRRFADRNSSISHISSITTTSDDGVWWSAWCGHQWQTFSSYYSHLGGAAVYTATSQQ